MLNLIPVDHDPFAVGPAAQPADPAIGGAGTTPPRLVPVDHDPFAAAPTGALPRIIVHPKPPNAPPDNPDRADGIDDWFEPTADGYPDDWFVPTPAATPGQSGPGAQSNAAVPPLANPPAFRPDPFAAFWSLIPASRLGAMAWDPPIFPGNSTSFLPDGSTTPVLPARPPAGSSNAVRTSGGLFDGLAQLASPTPYPEYALPFGGLLDAPPAPAPASSGPGTGSVSPTAQPQSADPQPAAPTVRRPITDYSAGEIAADGAKSFGVGVGRFGIQSAGFPGDLREALAGGAQRAADYFAPGSAPNAGANVSEYLASYPLLGGPTSAQLQRAVESYTGPFYQPKTIVGDYAQTAGEFVPGALLVPEGSLAANALRYGLLPAFSSETAGQLTKGTAAEPWARTVGAILGASANTWRDLPRIRSAPAGGGNIEQELAALSERVREIHGALDKIARSRRTTAILSTDGDTIVAGGKRDLDPVQRALIRPGEQAAKLPGADAEITALAKAENAGLIPRALATTRPICPDCKAVIEDARGVLTSKFTAVFPR
jgi:hypothetical protein